MNFTIYFFSLSISCIRVWCACSILSTCTLNAFNTIEWSESEKKKRNLLGTWKNKIEWKCRQTEELRNWAVFRNVRRNMCECMSMNIVHGIQTHHLIFSASLSPNFIQCVFHFLEWVRTKKCCCFFLCMKNIFLSWAGQLSVSFQKFGRKKCSLIVILNHLFGMGTKMLDISVDLDRIPTMFSVFLFSMKMIISNKTPEIHLT